MWTSDPLKVGVCSSFDNPYCSLFGNSIPGHTTSEQPQSLSCARSIMAVCLKMSQELKIRFEWIFGKYSKWALWVVTLFDLKQYFVIFERLVKDSASLPSTRLVFLRGLNISDLSVWWKVESIIESYLQSNSYLGWLIFKFPSLVVMSSWSCCPQANIADWRKRIVNWLSQKDSATD